MIHPDTELRFANPQIGYDVFATRFIPKGTITLIRGHIVAGPIRLIPTLPQPLWPFLEEKTTIEAAVSGRSPIASVKANYVNVVELLYGYPPLAR